MTAKCTDTYSMGELTAGRSPRSQDSQFFQIILRKVSHNNSKERFLFQGTLCLTEYRIFNFSGRRYAGDSVDPTPQSPIFRINDSDFRRGWAGQIGFLQPRLESATRWRKVINDPVLSNTNVVIAVDWLVGLCWGPYIFFNMFSIYKYILLVYRARPPIRGRRSCKMMCR